MPELKPGDWVVNMHSRKVSRFEALSKQGAVVVSVDADRITTCNPNNLIRLAGKHELDWLEAWNVQDFLESEAIERKWGFKERSSIRKDLQKDIEEAREYGYLPKKELVNCV